ncbi:MAG: hypothetical protein HKN99_01175 [Winogradskyella sp.]|nr:hypothetical protein [Winogradskyella sp.]
MKKIIGFCVVAFLFFIGTTSVNAQDAVKVNTAASEQAESLRLKVKFTTEQRKAVYEAFKFYHTAFAKYDLGKTENKELKLKYDERLTRELKTILTPEQFDRYMAIVEE